MTVRAFLATPFPLSLHSHNGTVLKPLQAGRNFLTHQARILTEKSEHPYIINIFRVSQLVPSGHSLSWALAWVGRNLYRVCN